MKFVRNIKKKIPTIWKEKFLFLLSYLLRPLIKNEIANTKNNLFNSNQTFKQKLAREWIRNKYYSSNPYNMVRATVKALAKINSPRQVAARRGKKVNEVISQRINDIEVSA